MDKRVYGILGISSVMANWNADFSGYPRTTSDGSIFGSDKALKYPMKKMWEDEGEKVLYIKSFKISKDKDKTNLMLRSMVERYEYIFDSAKVDKKNGTDVVLKNLFNAIDVKNFGATFAKKGNNISITGAVQIGQGFNKYEDTVAEEMTILSPFINESSNSKKDSESKSDDTDDDKSDKDDKGKIQSSIGTKIIATEAHYFYPFAINPSAYNEYVELGVTDGYTQEDYNKFKAAATTAVTSYATNSKIGCENELAVFVETKSDVYLPNLSEFVSFEKGDKNIITLTCDELLNELGDGILNVEIYYNPYKDEIKHNIKGAKHYNIFTKNEV
jgi:CRISPR-associated protein Csh2